MIKPKPKNKRNAPRPRVMKETPKHLQAFETWAGMETPAFGPVSKRFRVSVTSVAKWHKSFQWEIRRQAILAKAEKKVEDKLADQVAKAKSTQLGVIRGWQLSVQARINEMIKDGKMIPLPGPLNMNEFVAVGKHQLFLLGEETDRTSVEITLDDWVRGSSK